MAVPMGSAAKLVTFGGFNCCATSFRVAGVALCEIATGFVTCQKVLCDRRNTFARFSEDGLHFSWQAQHFGDLHRHFAWQAQHFRRVLLRVFATRIVRAATSGDNVQIAWQVWDIVRVYFTLCTPHPTFYTLHSALYTLHFTLHTLHLTFHNLHSKLYTLHSTLDTSHSTLYTLHITLHALHLTLRTPHFTVYTPHSTLYTMHFSRLTSNFALDTLHSTLYTPHFTLYTPHSTLYTPHSALYTPRFTLYTRYFTLHNPRFTPYTLFPTQHPVVFTLQTLTALHYIPHSTVYTGTATEDEWWRMYKTVEITCFTKVFYVTASLCVSTSVPLTTYEHSGSWAASCFLTPMSRTPVLFWWHQHHQKDLQILRHIVLERPKFIQVPISGYLLRFRLHFVFTLIIIRVCLKMGQTLLYDVHFS